MSCQPFFRGLVTNESCSMAIFAILMTMECRTQIFFSTCWTSFHCWCSTIMGYTSVISFELSLSITCFTWTAWFFGLVPVGEPTWLAVTVLCVVVGLSSNGIYDIPTIKNFIDKLFASKKGVINQLLRNLESIDMAVLIECGFFISSIRLSS